MAVSKKKASDGIEYRQTFPAGNPQQKYGAFSMPQHFLNKHPIPL